MRYLKTALAMLLTTTAYCKPVTWTLTVGQYHGRGTSGGGGSEYTVDSEGMVQSVSYQNGVAGPQPHHYRSRVAHPDQLPEVEKALRRLADSNPVQSYDPTLEYRYTIDGRSGQATFHQDFRKPIPGLAGELQKALDRMMRASDRPKEVGMIRTLARLSQDATATARQQGWSRREFQIDSLGRVLAIYHRGNSNLEGTWEETLRTLTPAERSRGKGHYDDILRQLQKSAWMARP
ncbi:hypothetical protein ABS71_01600 [bacterium SCN 62-11]|nr:MAG: hypothetical protein ABS71_01600 [bacterium SCN 62-11]